ncbi:glycosyltransferase [Kribbella sp. NBC_00662]|uniref:glycosyltransferase n=1 Tax=Kribbella sp. NBC_00662 TaxID=2975969 RepID=UPI00352B5785
MELGTGRHAQVVVLVPAHNEEAALPAALNSLWQQTRRPDRVIVVADNCTDGTVALATGPARRSSRPSATCTRRRAASTRRCRSCWRS